MARNQDRGHSPGAESSPRRIQSVDRAIDLLKAVSATRTPRTVGELADSCGLNRSTAWRLLMTLEHHGLIDRDTVTQRYVVGYEVLRLAASASAHELIASRARPIMDRLAQDSEETVSLVVLTPRGVVAIDQSDTRNIATVSVIGVHLPLHATASGKVRLAYATDAKREELLVLPLERLTDQTQIDRAALEQELEQVRRHGYAFESEEFEPGVASVAAPIFDARRHVAASISISGLAIRLPKSRLRELMPLVKQAGRAISEELKGKTDNAAAPAPSA